MEDGRRGRTRCNHRPAKSLQAGPVEARKLWWSWPPSRHSSDARHDLTSSRPRVFRLIGFRHSWPRARGRLSSFELNSPGDVTGRPVREKRTRDISSLVASWSRSRRGPMTRNTAWIGKSTFFPCTWKIMWFGKSQLIKVTRFLHVWTAVNSSSCHTDISLQFERTKWMGRVGEIIGCLALIKLYCKQVIYQCVVFQM